MPRKEERERNPEGVAEQQRRYRKKYPGIANRLNRKWEHANLEHVRRVQKEWRHRNPEYIRHRRRLWVYRKKGADGSHTRHEWEQLKYLYNYTCPMCLRSEPEIHLTEDHKIPLSLGGSNRIDNIQPLCHSCNSKKGIKIWFARCHINQLLKKKWDGTKLS